MAVAAQMNIRLAPELKEAGDAVLARMELSPTEFVRALWARLASDGEARAQLEHLVADHVDGDAVDNPRKIALVRAREHYATGMARLGIDDATYSSELSSSRTDEEIYVDALMSRMAERGM